MPILPDYQKSRSISYPTFLSYYYVHEKTALFYSKMTPNQAWDFFMFLMLLFKIMIEGEIFNFLNLLLLASCRKDLFELLGFSCLFIIKLLLFLVVCRGLITLYESFGYKREFVICNLVWFFVLTNNFSKSYKKLDF